METPNDINGIRTDAIMKSINDKMYEGGMYTSSYDRMYGIIYETLCKISIQNIAHGMSECGIKLFDTK